MLNIIPAKACIYPIKGSKQATNSELKSLFAYHASYYLTMKHGRKTQTRPDRMQNCYAHQTNAGKKPTKAFKQAVYVV
jgi:hypothetical protein